MQKLAIFLLLVTANAFAAEKAKPVPAADKGKGAAATPAPPAPPAAPAFTATTSQGKEVKLADYKGKVVMLEWLNHACEFDKKQYLGFMTALQTTYTGKGVVWLSVISSAEGKAGFVTPAQAETERTENHSKATAVILDKNGKLGKLYGAQTTPQVFVIDKKGGLIYQGAPDDKPNSDKDGLKGANSYAAAALEDAIAGRASAVPTNKPYGCPINY